MKNVAFCQWCSVATRRILYGPDREAVYTELRSHMEDHWESLVAQGISEKDAMHMVLQAMGDPEEIAPQLGALHKPFWGYLLRISRILAVIFLVLSLLPLWNYVADLHLYDAPHTHGFDVYDPDSYTDSSVRILHHLSEPNISFSSEAGTFTVTDAVVFTSFPDEYHSFTQLYLLIRQQSLLPWAEHEEYFQFDGVANWFSARDSLGNVYGCYWDTRFRDPGYVSSRTVQSGIFTGTHALWIYDFPKDAQWVEILYTRDGREYVLRIDLTGGDCT